MLLAVHSYGQIVAHTEDGRRVLLNKNGTWEFATDSLITKAPAQPKLPTKRNFVHPEFKPNVNADYYYQQTYDEFDEKTRTAIGVKIRDGLYLRFYYYSPGLTPKAVPDNVVMMFASVSTSPRFQETANLKLLLDGNRIEPGAFQRIANLTSSGIREFLYREIPLSTFLRILNSNYVGGQLHNTEFVLKREHLEAFRDFASRMK